MKDDCNPEKIGTYMSETKQGDTVATTEFQAAIVGQRQLRKISLEFVSIMFTLLLQLAIIIWWASGITTRVDSIEANRNTAAQGAVRDIQIGMLMKIAEENSRVHEVQNHKIDKIFDKLSDVQASVAGLEGTNDANHPRQ